ncbi:MAG: IS110 family transposase [Bacteroidales bacterium]|nr:IS110 family transposase [Bacteroidales bacterium]
MDLYQSQKQTTMQCTTLPRQILGIDVSKKTLDFCELSGKRRASHVIENDAGAIEAFLESYKVSETVIAMENTGRYNWALYEVLAQKEFIVYVLNPIHLHKSLGLVRGKDDKIDAYRVAEYTSRHLDQLQRWQPEDDDVQELKLLLNERNQLVATKKRISVRLSEFDLINLKDYSERLHRRSLRSQQEVDRDIKEVEREINELISANDHLSNVAQWITSVTGVGKVLCWYLIAKTNAFRNINNPRKIACYCGVAPFNHQSGTSLKKRPGVSQFADKQLKTLLHMGALTAVKYDPELRLYYRRKVEEGKCKMSVLNAVRNKLLQRICAVVRNEKNYERRLVLS